MQEPLNSTDYAATLRRWVAARGLGDGEPMRLLAARPAPQAGDAIVLLSPSAGIPSQAEASAENGKQQSVIAKEGALQACIAEAEALLTSACTCSHGLAAAAAEAAVSGGLGAILAMDSLPAEAEPDALLFAGQVEYTLVMLPKENLESLEALAARHSVQVRCLGMAGGDRLLFCDAHRVLLDVPVRELSPRAPQEDS